MPVFLNIIVIVFLLFFMGITFAQASETNNYPIYQNGELIIPRVDTPEQAGNFMDVIFQFDEQTNTWNLNDFLTDTAIDESQIDQIEVTITNSFPVQVFLKVKGEFPDGCSELGKTNQRLEDNKFEIILHNTFFANNPSNTFCGFGAVPFDVLIPLSVYGLSAGAYEYSVNGGDIGTFTLAEPNNL